MNPYAVIVANIQTIFAAAASFYPVVLPALHAVYDPIIAFLSH